MPRARRRGSAALAAGGRESRVADAGAVKLADVSSQLAGPPLSLRAASCELRASLRLPHHHELLRVVLLFRHRDRLATQQLLAQVGVDDDLRAQLLQLP